MWATVNRSPAKEATSKDEVEIEKFLREQKSKKKQHKCKSVGEKFCESLKEPRAIESIPANEPHCVRSVLATSVKILPYRPPARLIRA